MYGAAKGGDLTPKSGAKHNDDSKANNPMDDEKKNEIQDISEEAANSLRDIGCVVIRNGVRNDLTAAALRVINNALSQGPSCLSGPQYAENFDILDLWNESAAYSLCQNVFGLKNVAVPSVADIRLIFPEKDVVSPNGD